MLPNKKKQINTEKRIRPLFSQIVGAAPEKNNLYFERERKPEKKPPAMSVSFRKSIDFFGAIDGEIGRIAIYTSHKKVKKSNQKSKSIKVMYRLNTSLLLKILKSHD